MKVEQIKGFWSSGDRWIPPQVIITLDKEEVNNVNKGEIAVINVRATRWIVRTEKCAD